MKHFAFILHVLFLCAISDAVCQTTHDFPPIHKSSKAITRWATNCVIVRGYVRADNHESGLASFGKPEDATGPADNFVVSLGDGGTAILSFSEPIRNKPGPDFAVFENSFDGKYLELAFVEVSTDSVRWVRFPSVSNTQTSTQIGSFGTIDPGLVKNLAGKHPSMYGTPFWLEDIADSSGIDINDVNYVRVIDVVGSIDPLYASYDSRGNIINDPWPTPFPQSGFDLDAVAVVDVSLSGEDEHVTDKFYLYPVPADYFLYVRTGNAEGLNVRIRDYLGRVLSDWYMVSEHIGIPVEGLPPGMYLLEIQGETVNSNHFRKFLRK